MNQDDVILLGALLTELGESWKEHSKYGELIKKCLIVSEQAKASKDYQQLMDKLNNELSELGKDDKDA